MKSKGTSVSFQGSTLRRRRQNTTRKKLFWSGRFLTFYNNLIVVPLPQQQLQQQQQNLKHTKKKKKGYMLVWLYTSTFYGCKNHWFYFAFNKVNAFFPIPRYTMPGLKEICLWLDLDKKGTKDEIMERILAFCLKPEPSGKPHPQQSKSLESYDVEIYLD